MIYDQIATSPEPIVSIDGAREEAWKTGHVVAAFQTYNDAEMEPRTIDVVLRNRVDAVIYATVMTRQVDGARRRSTTPAFRWCCSTASPPTGTFPRSCPAKSPAATWRPKALIDAGHRRIAHITGEMWMDAARDRLKGYREALAACRHSLRCRTRRRGQLAAQRRL